MPSRTFVAALAAGTLLSGGIALAADGAGNGAGASPPPGHAAVVKDFSKLSADGVRAYQDLALARLAIFDGRTADAKKYVDDADVGFNKAKSDESVFTQAEAVMRTHVAQNGKGAGADQQSGAAGESKAANAADAKEGNVDAPIAWLPVDGTVTINEDYSLQPAKAKAVADANKSLAQGDRKGAMDKLKLASVDTAVSLAVVPLQQTIKDVDQAKQLIDNGQFYEGSQKLRAVQDATVLTIADLPATAAGGKGGGQGGGQASSSNGAAH